MKKIVMGLAAMGLALSIAACGGHAAHHPSKWYPGSEPPGAPVTHNDPAAWQDGYNVGVQYSRGIPLSAKVCQAYVSHGLVIHEPANSVESAKQGFLAGCEES